ncbi:hypothetical protein [Burkholderia cepacia]|uniref:hypothetical protein n=1 Tax=Burkholderia cepacia TaxID=292 RepID=UPI001626576E|nr:hypothetical protein [Burkholderia cepacia]
MLVDEVCVARNRTDSDERHVLQLELAVAVAVAMAMAMAMAERPSGRRHTSDGG